MDFRNILLPFRRLMWAILRKLNPPTCRCPCCGCTTLYKRMGFEICPVCAWEDDGQDDDDADVVRGELNGELSLTKARLNYKEFGACDRWALGHVRAPKPYELAKSNAQSAPNGGPG